MIPTQSAEVEVIAPESIRVGAVTLRSGGRLFRAARALLAREMTREEFCREVWGEVRGEAEIGQVIDALNRLLAGLKSSRRIVREGELIRLC